MAEAVPQMVDFKAPPAWRTVDFISDLHLQAREPATFMAWQRYMLETPADAVFILGDLFEAWIGDDVIETPAGSNSGFESACAEVLRQTSSRAAVFFMHGNRDFLVGERLMRYCGVTLLADPTVLVFPGLDPENNQRWLLSHGDALCIDDLDYMQFRRQVRSTQWQRAFLSKPLAERQSIARQLRQQSETIKQAAQDYADVDTSLARQWLEAAGAHQLIHGHTHKPAVHDLGGGNHRHVLSDWDAAATPPRAEVLRLTRDGLQRIAV